MDENLPHKKKNEIKMKNTCSHLIDKKKQNTRYFERKTLEMKSV